MAIIWGRVPVTQSLPRRSASASDPLMDGSRFVLDRPDTLTGEYALDYLDIVRLDSMKGKPLTGLTVIAVGAGPAGLTFARFACALGAKVTVLEKAGDPRGKDDGYTDRSFNITLLNVGRCVLGDPHAWDGGFRLVGRAAHRQNGEIKYAEYGPVPDTDLISIPRPTFRRNLVALAEKQGAHVLFRHRVTSIDSDKGCVEYTDETGASQTMTADLVLMCDGLHSFANAASRQPSETTIMHPDEQDYMIAQVKSDKQHPLSLHYIHFWKEPASEAYAIGIPMADGTFGLLMMSRFGDIDRRAHPFATPHEAKRRLEKDFTQLYKTFPELAAQLPHHRRGRFYYKRIPRYKLGPKCVAIGDAGCAFPSNAGFGANSAMYGASSLVYHLAQYPHDTAKGCDVYARHLERLSSLLNESARIHNEFHRTAVVDNPETNPDSIVLAGLIKRMQAECDT